MHIYIIGPEAGRLKVGLADNPKLRLRQLQVGHPEQLFLHYFEKVDRHLSYGVERYAHSRLEHAKMAGEWFTSSVKEAVAAVQEAIASVTLSIASDSPDERWTIRGVSRDVRRRLIETAALNGETVGDLLSRLVMDAIPLAPSDQMSPRADIASPVA